MQSCVHETFLSDPRPIGLCDLKAAIRFRTHEHADHNHSLRGQRFRWRPSVEKEHDGFGGADWESYGEMWIHTSELDTFESVRSGVLRSGEMKVGQFLTSVYMDLGSPMKGATQSDSSTANSLADRLGAGHRTKHIDTRHLWIQERAQDGDLHVTLICGQLGGCQTKTDSITPTHCSNQNAQRKAWEHLDSNIRMRNVFCC